MQTFLGASTTLEKDDLKDSYFDNIDYVLIEGYLWSSPSAREAIKKAGRNDIDLGQFWQVRPLE